MTNQEEKAAALEKAAADVRVRVQDALKQACEQEVLTPVAWLDFSKVEHVVSQVLDPKQQEGEDDGLLCIGDIDGEEEKFRRFAELLSELRGPASPGA